MGGSPPGWHDGFAVFAYSVKKAFAKSAWDMELLALVQESMQHGHHRSPGWIDLQWVSECHNEGHHHTCYCDSCHHWIVDQEVALN